MQQINSNKILVHLKKDKILKKIINKSAIIKQSNNEDLYFYLLKAIVGQQLSVKAADTIWNRFLLLFKDSYPKNILILKLSSQQLRSVGLSFQKINYIINIANFSITHSLDYKLLHAMSDQDLMNYLIEIKGVGKWTIEMLMIFNLNREDVFPIGDLGIQNGIKSLYDLKLEKKDLFKEMINISNQWRPYRTMACLYIWKYKDLMKNN